MEGKGAFVPRSVKDAFWWEVLEILTGIVFWGSGIFFKASHGLPGTRSVSRLLAETYFVCFVCSVHPL